jgi:uncharacterized protein
VHDPTVGEMVELVVLGAGPAGLSAGLAALERGVDCVVLERGTTASSRDRARAEDLVSGVGGAGLYSDGKFSFAPSATALWVLKPMGALREAYRWVADQLGEHGISAPAFPEGADQRHDAVGGPLKPYPSQYMPLEDRMRLVGSLAERLGPRLIVGSSGRLAGAETGVIVETGSGLLDASAGIIATGRFGPLDGLTAAPPRFRRVEVGMRVEQDADSFALDDGSFGELLDPKWVLASSDGRFEWRTFCCCRGGEVVETCFDGLTTVSGRADGPATGRSNFGLNVRFVDAREGLDALEFALLAARQPALEVEASELLDSPETCPVAERLGANASGALAAGLQALGQQIGQSFRGATLHVPALEGVGYYPPVDDTLRVAKSVWAAGDATGVFRGLVPALVSGRVAAMAASDALARQR